jgi:two-component system LytT family response regulator
MPMNSFVLKIATSEGTHFIHPEEIVRLEACSNYTYIHFTNRTKLLASKVLKEFAASLEPIGFIRTHKTHLLNRNQISSIRRDGSVIMRDNSMVGISRRMKREVMREMKNG